MVSDSSNSTAARPIPRRRLPWPGGAIRRRILLAFLAMAVITAGLGAYAVHSIKQSGVLVTRTFDQSLMSVSYARAAAADFQALQAALVHRAGSDPQSRNRLDGKVAALEQALAEDLTIVAERSQSLRAAATAGKVRELAVTWAEARRRLEGAPSSDGAWQALEGQAAEVEQRIDLLVNYTAGDGFTFRQEARAAIGTAVRLNLFTTVAALLLSAAVTAFLTRRIVGPVAIASTVAGRIAKGELETEIPQGGPDELGALLAAMTLMRNNIKRMVEEEKALRCSAQARLADALESSREGVLLLDAERRIVLANEQAAAFLGRPRDGLLGQPFTERAEAMAGSANEKTEIGADRPSTTEIRSPGGRWLRISESATQEGGSIVVCSDISALKEQKASLRATNLRLDAALSNMSQGLCLYDAANRLQVVNRRFCEIFGMPFEGVQPGLAYRNVLELSAAAGNHDETELAEIEARQAAAWEDGTASSRMVELRDGRVVAVTQRRTEDGGWIATYEDVTERRRTEARILFMARHDALTGLANRVLFLERVEQALAQAGAEGGFAVLCLDLDGFKQVNDTLGHPVGDVLLRQVGERLRACVRDTDTVARLGGDEFAIVFNGVKRIEDVEALARRVIAVIGEPYDLDGQRAAIGVSIGVSLAPGNGTSGRALLKNADLALYGAKDEGRGTWRLFQADMDRRLQARRAMELDLREALAKGEFELFFQPLYDLRLERICGFEALLRWRHPTRGMVSPADFIPLAEEIGLIVPIGAWVLQRACEEAARWPEGLKVAVNISPIQFKDGFLVQTVLTALARSGLRADRLEVELTESVLLTSTAATLATLHALRELGARLSLDDFGTGYSSLSYLRSFPFDKIKVDRSFVQDLGSDNGSDAIVSATIGLASKLGMRITAEGVETPDQLERLRRGGCDEAQGFLISRPVPAAEVGKLLGGERAVQAA